MPRWGRSLGWGDHSERLTLEQFPLFTDVSGNPPHPKLQSCWPGICPGQVSFAGSVRSGEVGSASLQVRGSPGGCLGDDWRAGKRTHSTFPLCRPVCRAWDGKLENPASIFI